MAKSSHSPRYFSLNIEKRANKNHDNSPSYCSLRSSNRPNNLSNKNKKTIDFYIKWVYYNYRSGDSPPLSEKLKKR